jgi:hypothetical protein
MDNFLVSLIRKIIFLSLSLSLLREKWRFESNEELDYVCKSSWPQFNKVKIVKNLLKKTWFWKPVVNVTNILQAMKLDKKYKRKADKYFFHEKVARKMLAKLRPINYTLLFKCIRPQFTKLIVFWMNWSQKCYLLQNFTILCVAWYQNIFVKLKTDWSSIQTFEKLNYDCSCSYGPKYNCVKCSSKYCSSAGTATV